MDGTRPVAFTDPQFDGWILGPVYVTRCLWCGFENTTNLLEVSERVVSQWMDKHKPACPGKAPGDDPDPGAPPGTHRRRRKRHAQAGLAWGGRRRP